MFCGEKREEFSEEVLETHYLTDCPVLHQCQYCTEVGMLYMSRQLSHTQYMGIQIQTHLMAESN